MAVYTVRTRDVFVLGWGWVGQRMGYTYQLPKEIAADRDEIQNWLDTHAGDFQRIDDFAASIEAVEIPWRVEEDEYEWFNICGGVDDETN